MKPNLKYSRFAKKDLQQISDYLVDVLANRQVVTKVISKIIKLCAVLKNYPMLGLALEDKFGIKTDYRCIIIGEYIAFNNIVDETIWVRRIFSSRRDYIKDLFLE